MIVQISYQLKFQNRTTSINWTFFNRPCWGKLKSVVILKRFSWAESAIFWSWFTIIINCESSLLPLITTLPIWRLYFRIACWEGFKQPSLAILIYKIFDYAISTVIPSPETGCWKIPLRKKVSEGWVTEMSTSIVSYVQKNHNTAIYWADKQEWETDHSSEFLDQTQAN